MLSWLDLESKGLGHSKNQKPMPLGTKNLPPKKNLSRSCLNNWCDADSDADADKDADISKTIGCRHPTRGQHYQCSSGNNINKLPLINLILIFNSFYC